MKIIVVQDPDKKKREIGHQYLADFNHWHLTGEIGETYQHLVSKAKEIIKGWKRISSSDSDDIARDAALDAWKHLADRHHSHPLHVCNELSLCLRQKIVRILAKTKSMKTFGSREELTALGFSDDDNGGIDRTILYLDLSYKLKHDLADFRSSLAMECLEKQLLTIREIQEYAGFSQAQARELKAIMTTIMEDYCGIS